MKDKRRSDLTFEGMTFVQIASGQENVFLKTKQMQLDHRSSKVTYFKISMTSRLRIMKVYISFSKA